MKKMILFASAAALLMAGCSSEPEDIVKNGGDDPRAISFRTVTQKNRATEVTSKNIGSFKVFALNDLTSDGFDYMDGTNVVRETGAATWNYSPVKYWPADNSKIDFYAYSPAGSVNVGGFDYTAAVVSPAADQKADLVYVVPFTAAAGADGKTQEDFLIAKAVQKNIDNISAGKVPITFDHALSMATFSAKNSTEEATFLIEKIELINLVNKGTLDMAAATPAWTVDASAMGIYVAGIPAAGIPVLPNTTTPVGLTAPNEGLMIMPQVTANGTYDDDLDNSTIGTTDDPTPDGLPDDLARDKFFVKLTFCALDATGDDIYSSGSVCYFAVPSTFKFDMKTRYNFVFNLKASAPGDPDPGPITLVKVEFDVTVNNWQAPDDDPTELLP